MDIIQRNIYRLAGCGDFDPKEPLEPMSPWKWHRLYKKAVAYGIGPWVAEGILRHADDFFMQIPPTLYQQFMELKGEKRQERLDRYMLSVTRSQGLRYRLSRQSVKVYISDFINTVKNIEE